MNFFLIFEILSKNMYERLEQKIKLEQSATKSSFLQVS